MPPGQIFKNERKIIVLKFKIAKEMSLNDDPEIYELGHYLTNNLISKICIIIALENRLNFQYKTKKGKLKTQSLEMLYNNVLKKVYPNILDYKEIEDLHKKRDFYEHEYDSIESHFNKQYALDFIEKIEKIMKDIGFISRNIDLKPTFYLRKTEVFISKGNYSNKILSGFQKFYNRMKEKNKINIIIDLKNIIEHDIGFKKFCSVLGFIGTKKSDIYYNDLWELTIKSHPSVFAANIKDKHNFEIYNFNEPLKNEHILNRWLGYFNDQCEKNEIFIKD